MAKTINDITSSEPLKANDVQPGMQLDPREQGTTRDVVNQSYRNDMRGGANFRALTTILAVKRARTYVHLTFENYSIVRVHKDDTLLIVER